MIGEIVGEVWHEVSAEPIRFAAEVVQFLILAGLVWFVAIGFGGRRGFVRNMLEERAETSEERLRRALGAQDELTHAKQLAALKVRTARAEARKIVADAKQSASAMESAERTQADSEAERILSRVDDALSAERDEMLAEVREELVEVVSQSTRQLLNERLTVAEQRRLIEEHVVASIGSESVESVVGA